MRVLNRMKGMDIKMVNRKKRVCLLIYSLGSGGAEHVLSQWSMLLSHNSEIYLTIFDGEKQPNYEYYGDLYNLNVKSDNRNLFKKIIIVIKRSLRLFRFVKKNKIDLVLSFCNECNLVNTLSMHGAKKVCSIRSVSDIHANIFVKYVIKNKRNILIVQTETLKKMLISQYGNFVSKKTLVFGNPFDAELIISKTNEPVPKSLDIILSNKKTIINVASLKPSKNHENLLRSFELVCDKLPDIYLLIVGADPVGRGERIRKMASKSKYSDHIIFVGELKNPFPVLKKSSLFVLPSLAEGIPNALAEAMICGIPSIASDCPTGPKELLSDTEDIIEYNEKGYAICRYGILVKSFKGSASPNYNYDKENYYFANAIIDVFESSDLYNELKCGAENGAARFDINKYEKELNELITTLM